MSTAARALLLGSFAGGVVAVVVASGIALAASAARSPLRVALGPVAVVEVDVSGSTSAVLLGPGLLLVALALGVANALAALALARRRGARAPIA